MPWFLRTQRDAAYHTQFGPETAHSPHDKIPASRQIPPGNERIGIHHPIKIAYIIETLQTGGAERQLLELLGRLDRKRFDPSLVLFNANYAVRATGKVSQVKCLQIPLRRRSWTHRLWREHRIARGFFALIDHLRVLRPTIMHTFLPAASILGSTAAKWVGVPIVVVSRRSLVDCYRSRSRMGSRADRFTMRFATLLLGNSAAVTREAIDLDDVPADRARTIYNGVDTSRFHPSNDRSLRAELGWGEEHVVFGMVANFFPYKRHVDFVRAASLIHDRFPHARFVMAGRDEGTLEVLLQELQQASAQDYVAVLRPLDSPEKLFAAMDVCVSTSDSEGFSNVLLEAMACGKPVIATAVGGNPEAVVDGETGYLVPVRSPQAIADSAAKLLTNPSLRTRMAESARRRVEDHFTVEHMVREHEDLYTELLGRLL